MRLVALLSTATDIRSMKSILVDSLFMLAMPSKNEVRCDEIELNIFIRNWLFIFIRNWNSQFVVEKN